MHVRVGSVWKIEQSREEEQRRGLEELVPMVQREPAFVAGYWTSDQQAGGTDLRSVLGVSAPGGSRADV